MTKFKQAIYAAGAVIAMSCAAHAVPVQYQLTVEADFRSATFGQTVEFGGAARSYNVLNRVEYTDPNASVLENFRWVDHARATSGTLEFIYDDENPGRSGPTFTNCTGVLASMCDGSFTRVNMADHDFSSTNSNSFLTRLREGSLEYTDDAGYSWADGFRQYQTMGYGVTVTHDISALSLTAVPLPSSLAFLLGGLGLLVGARRFKTSKRAVA